MQAPVLVLSESPLVRPFALVLPLLECWLVYLLSGVHTLAQLLTVNDRHKLGSETNWKTSSGVEYRCSKDVRSPLFHSRKYVWLEARRRIGIVGVRGKGELVGLTRSGVVLQISFDHVWDQR